MHAYVKTRKSEEGSIIAKLKEMSGIKEVEPIYGMVGWDIYARIVGSEKEVGDTHLKIMNLPITDSQLRSSQFSYEDGISHIKNMMEQIEEEVRISISEPNIQSFSRKKRIPWKPHSGWIIEKKSLID